MSNMDIPVKERKSWDRYFMDMALNAASRGTCDRAQVGAVIVDPENDIVATGYNGSPGPGGHHCDEDGHVWRDGHCIATIHAEQNALMSCARTGKSSKGCTMYVTHFPCIHCTKLLISARISKVIFLNAYRIDEYALKLLGDFGIEVSVYDPDKELTYYVCIDNYKDVCEHVTREESKVTTA